MSSLHQFAGLSFSVVSWMSSEPVKRRLWHNLRSTAETAERHLGNNQLVQKCIKRQDTKTDHSG